MYFARTGTRRDVGIVPRSLSPLSFSALSVDRRERAFGLPTSLLFFDRRLVLAFNNEILKLIDDMEALSKGKLKPSQIRQKVTIFLTGKEAVMYRFVVANLSEESKQKTAKAMFLIGLPLGLSSIFERVAREKNRLMKQAKGT